MIGDIALGVHITAGASGLAVGPIAIRNAVRSAGGPRAGAVYHWLVAAVCLSAVLLALLDWSRLWFFVPIAVASYGFALVGHLAPKRRRGSWRQAHVRGYGGAYIALITAVFVVSFTSLPLLWLLPTVVGAPALHRLSPRERAGEDPGPADALGAHRASRDVRSEAGFRRIGSGSAKPVCRPGSPHNSSA